MVPRLRATPAATSLTAGRHRHTAAGRACRVGFGRGGGAGSRAHDAGSHAHAGCCSRHTGDAGADRGATHGAGRPCSNRRHDGGSTGQRAGCDRIGCRGGGDSA